MLGHTLFIWYVTFSSQFWQASTLVIMLASFARMTACEVSGFPKTIRWDVHLTSVAKHRTSPFTWCTYFRHSSTIRRCAVMEQQTSIQRSWLKLLRITCIPFPICPRVCETGTRTYCFWYACQQIRLLEGEGRIYFIESYIGCPCSRWVGRLDSLGRNTWTTFDQQNSETRLNVESDEKTFLKADQR